MPDSRAVVITSFPPTMWFLCVGVTSPTVDCATLQWPRLSLLLLSLRSSSWNSGESDSSERIASSWVSKARGSSLARSKRLRLALGTGSGYAAFSPTNSPRIALALCRADKLNDLGQSHPQRSRDTGGEGSGD